MSDGNLRSGNLVNRGELAPYFSSLIQSRSPVFQSRSHGNFAGDYGWLCFRPVRKINLNRLALA